MEVNFLCSSIKNGQTTRTELENICRFHVPELKLSKDHNALAFLVSIAGVESSFGRNSGPRFELGYSRSSLAFKRSKLLMAGHEDFGDLAAMSYGPFQILWVVAAELNYMGHPCDLHHAVVSTPWVIRKMNQHISHGDDTPERLALCWNQGNSKNTKNPYAQKVMRIYNDLKAMDAYREDM